MAIYNEQRKLCYTQEQLFELVAQVEHYPEFLPLWRSVRVSKNEQKETGNRIYVTDQVIKIGPFYKPFRTQTELEAFHRIHITSFDSLFQQFTIDWVFSPLNEPSGKKSSEKEDKCQIDFKLNCVASSILIRPVFDIALLDTAQSIVSAFENRARSIYDH